ncbi:hypothetical protein JCM11641_006447 [Rhodosporidiobolus odoratus]
MSAVTTPTDSTQPQAPSDMLSDCPLIAPSPPPPPIKRVSFCPLALLIDVAGDGEIEQAMVQAQQQALGKRKVAVRTYSIEAPNLGEVAGKAWLSVVQGFSASLDPFRSGGSNSSGVCSASRARDTSPERERESSLSQARSRSRSRSPSPGRGRGLSPALDPMDEDPSFIPNSPARLKLKIPTLRRECSIPCFGASKPILRRSSVSCGSPQTYSTTSLLPSPSPLDSCATSPNTSIPRLLPSLSRTSSHPTCSPAHPSVGLTIPLAACCSQCEPATLYGCRAPSEGEGAYEVKWSKEGRKKRDEEEKERVEKERWEEGARRIHGKYEAPRGVVKVEGSGAVGEDGEEEKEAELAEEEARESKLAKMAKEGGVDELKRAKKHVPQTGDALSTASDAQDMDGLEVGMVMETDKGMGGEGRLFDTTITEEPLSSTLDLDTPCSTLHTLATQVAVLPRRLDTITIASTHTSSSSSEPASAPCYSEPSSSASPPRPPKRRLSSATSTASPSARTLNTKPSFSQKISAIGSSMFTGASSGMAYGVRAGI